MMNRQQLLTRLCFLGISTWIATPAEAMSGESSGDAKARAAMNFGAIQVEDEELDVGASEVQVDDAAAPRRGDPLTQIGRHGVSIMSGPAVIPRWYFSSPLAAFSTSRCRGGGPGDKAREAGAIRASGCNWYVGVQYLFRKSENLDLAGSFEYRKFALPDALWLKRKDWASGCEEDEGPESSCDLGMADYVEADFSHLYLGGEATGYGTLYRDNNVRVQLGGGGGFGLVIFTGKLLRQTPLGRAEDGRPSSAEGSTCETLDDFSDFERCQPQWWDDPEVDQDGDGDRDNDVLDDSKLEDQDGFADCSANRCDPEDLERFGTRDKTFSTPILALPKLYLSARVLIKETFGINFRGGFNGGLYMGANFQYFFGSK